MFIVPFMIRGGVLRTGQVATASCSAGERHYLDGSSREISTLQAMMVHNRLDRVVTGLQLRVLCQHSSRRFQIVAGPCSWHTSFSAL
jgi:hypothetical protein